jgi:hypothetical protein
MICGVIGIECFILDKTKLIPREIAILTIKEKLYHTLIDLTCFDEERLECASNVYVKKTAHGLTIHPGYEEKNIPYEKYKRFIQLVYDEIKTETHFVLAYKGIEKTILKELEIPSLNLEDIGCPNFRVLSERYKNDNIVFDCGNHIIIRRKSFPYCPMQEITLFLKWIKEKKIKSNQIKSSLLSN